MFKQVRPRVLSECAESLLCKHASLPVLSYTLRVSALLSTWTDTYVSTRANDTLDGNAATALEGCSMMAAKMLYSTSPTRASSAGSSYLTTLTACAAHGSPLHLIMLKLLPDTREAMTLQCPSAAN